MTCRIDEVPVAWTPIGNSTRLSLVSDAPLGPTNPVALHISSAAGGPQADSAVSGIANSGFWGINVQPNSTYHVSVYLKRAPGSDAPTHVRSMISIMRVVCRVAACLMLLLGSIAREWQCALHVTGLRLLHRCKPRSSLAVSIMPS